MKRAESAKRWAEHIKDWRASGLNLREYCRRQSLCYRTFLRWRERRLANPARRGSQETQFVQVVVRDEGSAVAALTDRSASEIAEPGLIRIELRGERSLTVTGRVDEALLGRLIRLLEALPC